MLACDEIDLLVPQARGYEQRIPGVDVVRHEQHGAVHAQLLMAHIEFYAHSALDHRVQQPPDPLVPFVFAHSLAPRKKLSSDSISYHKAVLLTRKKEYENKELCRNKLCKDGVGFFACSEAENRRNTLCISSGTVPYFGTVPKRLCALTLLSRIGAPIINRAAIRNQQATGASGKETPWGKSASGKQRKAKRQRNLSAGKASG